MSSESHDADLKDIVKTTSAVVFMGTSHKGSKQWAAKGSKAQTIAGTLFMDNNPALLDTLGLKMASSSDLQTGLPQYGKSTSLP